MNAISFNHDVILPSRVTYPAAVLVPIIERSEPMVLFTIRTQQLASHAGQVAFPGGKGTAHMVSLAMAADVAETTLIQRPPRGREEAPVQISRLLEAHELILKEARTMAKQADDAGDDGTNDLLVSNVIRTNELQVWFLAEHLVDVPLVRADQGKAATAKG